jgi:cell division protein FtsB
MNIEFHMPHGRVAEKVVKTVRDNLIKLYHSYKNISRAEVYFKEQGRTDRNKFCEIDLTIFGSSLSVQRSAPSFQQATAKTLKAVADKVNEQIEKLNQQPDIITSTVRV